MDEENIKKAIRLLYHNIVIVIIGLMCVFGMVISAFLNLGGILVIGFGITSIICISTASCTALNFIHKIEKKGDELGKVVCPECGVYIKKGVRYCHNCYTKLRWE